MRRRPPSLRPLRLLSIAALAVTAGACGDATEAAPAASVARIELPAETVEPVDTTAAPDTLAPTTAASTTTAAATTLAPTTVEATAAPTVVVTLPQPEAPPEPRADEPYTEIGRIEIPKIGLDHVLLRGITLTTLDQGPGYWPGTAMPGQLGNTVIAGHRTSHGKEFRHIDDLVAGDEVIFTTEAGRFVYTVVDTTVVAPDAMYIIDQTPEATATLFACHPPGSTRQRIVVHLALQA
jgi:sortase A